MASSLPNFLVIGAARSGTTALYHALSRHPEVFMAAVKEPNFFAFGEGELNFFGPGADFVNNSVNTIADYRNLFVDSGRSVAIGEASPLYLYSPQAPARIAETLGEIKLIAVLRNPVEQAFSHYLYARARTIEPIDSFADALAAQPEREKRNWQPMFQYSRFPRYGEQLKRFLDVFPRENLQVHLYEDFVSDPDRVFRSIWQFIGVNPGFMPPKEHVNQGGIPRHAGLQRFIMQPTVLSPVLRTIIPETTRQRLRNRLSGNNIVRPPFPAQLRGRLQDELAEDIALTERLIGRDLSHWCGEPSMLFAARSVA